MRQKTVPWLYLAFGVGLGLFAWGAAKRLKARVNEAASRGVGVARRQGAVQQEAVHGPHMRPRISEELLRDIFETDAERRSAPDDWIRHESKRPLARGEGRAFFLGKSGEFRKGAHRASREVAQLPLQARHRPVIRLRNVRRVQSPKRFFEAICGLARGTEGQALRLEIGVFDCKLEDGLIQLEVLRVAAGSGRRRVSGAYDFLMARQALFTTSWYRAL
jgi:hypothetical protein